MLNKGNRLLQSRYRVVLGASLTQFYVIGLLFSYGLFFPVFEAEFGWSRTLVSGSSALSVFMMGVLAMIGGRLSDRVGPQLVLSFTGLAMGLGFVLVSQVSQPWQLFALFGTLIALGLSTHDVVTLSTVARWFEKRRGIMSGVVKVGTALGQVTIPPVAALLILSYGWRTAVVVLGISAMIVLLIAAQMMKNPPPVEGVPNAAKRAGLSFAEARKTRTFWTLCVIQFLFFPAMMSVPLHIAVHGMDLGMTSATAALLLSVVGASSVLGRLIIGGLVDKIGGKKSLALCFAVLGLSLGAMVGINSHSTLFVVVGFYGFTHGGLFTVVSPTVAAYFGMRAHGAIFGVVLFCGTIGGSIGPILMGLAFDRTGSYQLAFQSLTLLAVIGLLLVVSLPAANRGPWVEGQES